MVHRLGHFLKLLKGVEEMEVDQRNTQEMFSQGKYLY